MKGKLDEGGKKRQKHDEVRLLRLERKKGETGDEASEAQEVERKRKEESL